ncbi:AraC family transcriptional regulator [Arcticibacterium luteifluviistationis]|uniref:AraC family transcriptional regulator n=1 Tax=Arcticibacterium luteifluviistationis TaxID=1784714 RepID=A0A2Z4G8J0_9BACT|nr:AraC family transcriptional regulator [Arcticibacterium luteifluviistationis]AWV97464.1 AraC family transcriptional regulator [Arcticibacterium luteifluviistationis]
MKTFRRYFDLANTEANADMGINILNLGHHVHPINVHYPDPKHPDSYYFEWEKGRNLKEFQMLYIPNGSGFFEANGMKPQKVDAGTVILLYPGVWHRYKPNPKTGWEEYWIGFSGNYAHYLLEQECFSPQNPLIKVGFNSEFTNTFSKLMLAVENKDDSYRKFSSFLLIQLLGIAYTSALISKNKKTKKETLVESIIEEIHTNWNKHLDFKLISAKQNVSYVWFRKAFKEITGTSPNQYHIMLKIRKAEQQIQESNLTLSEIAYNSGFESESYFSRIFKQKMGYNPSELRKINISASTKSGDTSHSS